VDIKILKYVFDVLHRMGVHWLVHGTKVRRTSLEGEGVLQLKARRRGSAPTDQTTVLKLEELRWKERECSNWKPERECSDCDKSDGLLKRLAITSRLCRQESVEGVGKNLDW
jgi:ribosomal protein S14